MAYFDSYISHTIEFFKENFFSYLEFSELFLANLLEIKEYHKIFLYNFFHSQDYINISVNSSYQLCRENMSEIIQTIEKNRRLKKNKKDYFYVPELYII